MIFHAVFSHIPSCKNQVFIFLLQFCALSIMKVLIPISSGCRFFFVSFGLRYCCTFPLGFRRKKSGALINLSVTLLIYLSVLAIMI